jgi:signal transduction histidine kinase
LRLTAYFAALAALGCWLGVAALRAAHGQRQREWILCACVTSVCALGVAGVVFHRLKVIRARWLETERYLARIRAESSKYRALLEGAADMLLLVDPSTENVLEDNARARAALPLDRSRATPRLEGLLAAEALTRLRQALGAALATPSHSATAVDLETTGRDGRTLLVDAHVAAVELGRERLLLVSLRDRSAQKEIERQLAIRERLSSLGLLTAGVAHEVNNPLEGIGNYLALLERTDLAPEQRARYLQAVRHGFERIRDIARELLRFARPRSLERRAEVAEVIERALSLVRLSERLRQASVTVEGAEPGQAASGDPGQLEQVLVNLLMNAGAAAGPSGRIAVRVRRLEPAAGRPPSLEIAVEDDGPGIPAQHLERIFDPFFTTGGGTGLGLAISCGLVNAMGGSLRAENRPQGGACFRLTLPAWSG